MKMIEINLLPKEFRVKKRAKSSGPVALPLIPIAIGVSALVIIVHIFFGVAVFVKGNHAGRFEGEWEELRPLKEKYDVLSTETGEMEKAIKFVKKISGTEIKWHQLLGGLDEAIIPGVWLSRLALESSGNTFNYKDTEQYPTRLVLTGHFLGNSEVATSGVARFINSLKANKDFSGFFREIELIDMNSKVVDDEATMLFRLKCEFPIRTEEPKKAVSKRKRKR